MFEESKMDSVDLDMSLNHGEAESEENDWSCISDKYTKNEHIANKTINFVR
jgi:hypothetical protein